MSSRERRSVGDLLAGAKRRCDAIKIDTCADMIGIHSSADIGSVVTRLIIFLLRHVGLVRSCVQHIVKVANNCQPTDT